MWESIKKKYNGLPNWKKRILTFLFVILFANLGFSFYFILNTFNITIKIVEPPLKIYVNKDNYFESSNYSEVFPEEMINEGLNANIELNNTNLAVLPIFGEKESLVNDFNLSLVIYSPIKNLDNILEVWVAKVYSSSCYKSIKLGKIETQNGTKLICGIKKYSDYNTSSNYFATVKVPLESEDPTKPYLVVFRVNPLYTEEIPLNITPKVFEIYN